MEDSSNFFSLRYQTLLNQFQLDDNVQTLLIAIRDAFEFAKDADVLTNIQRGSTQEKILEEMLQCVSESAEFIESYAKDLQVGTSSWPLSLVITNILLPGKRVLKNIGGQLDDKVETYRATLLRLHKKFLAYTSVIAGAAVLQIRDDVRARQTEKSNQALETGAWFWQVVGSSIWQGERRIESNNWRGAFYRRVAIQR
jgi:hypothetical protein